MYGLQHTVLRRRARRILTMGLPFLALLAESPQLATAQPVPTLTRGAADQLRTQGGPVIKRDRAAGPTLMPGQRLTFVPTAGEYSCGMCGNDEDRYDRELLTGPAPCPDPFQDDRPNFPLINACLTRGSKDPHYPLSALVGTSVAIARRSRTESSTFTFDVETAGAMGRIVPAQISGSVDIRGFLLVVGLAEANASVSLDVVDVTDTNAPFSVHCAPIASYDQAISEMTFGLSISYEGSLGSISVIGGTAGNDFEIEIPVTSQVVRDSVTFGFPVLLQLGHSYELQLNFSASAKTGVAGGISVANFSDRFDWDMPNILCPEFLLLPLETVFPFVNDEFPNFTLGDLGLDHVFEFPTLTFDIGGPLNIPRTTIINGFEVDLPGLTGGFNSTNDLLKSLDIPITILDIIKRILPPPLNPDIFAVEEPIRPAGVFLNDLSVVMDEDEFAQAEEALAETLALTTAAKEEILALITASQMQVIFIIETNEALALRLRIENNLSHMNDQKGVGLFMLPAKFGGHLELTREILVETIDAMVAAGQNIYNAKGELAGGDKDVLAKQYKSAYSRYRKAYRSAVRG